MYASTVSYQEHNGTWEWVVTQGNRTVETGIAGSHHEARLLGLRLSITAVIGSSYRIGIEQKDDAVQHVLGTFWRQLEAEPELAANTDSWWLYRAVGYASEWCKCDRRRTHLNDALEVLSPDAPIEAPGAHDRDELAAPDTWDIIDAELDSSVRLRAFLAGLSDKERTVAIGLAAGCAKKDIATRLGVSAGMVTRHVARLAAAWEAFSTLA
jgi:DNA-directed RNA polymerase specialized sigma24 family protein